MRIWYFLLGLTFLPNRILYDVGVYQIKAIDWIIVPLFFLELVQKKYVLRRNDYFIWYILFVLTYPLLFAWINKYMDPYEVLKIVYAVIFYFIFSRIKLKEFNSFMKGLFLSVPFFIWELGDIFITSFSGLDSFVTYKTDFKFGGYNLNSLSIFAFISIILTHFAKDILRSNYCYYLIQLNLMLVPVLTISRSGIFLCFTTLFILFILNIKKSRNIVLFIGGLTLVGFLVADSLDLLNNVFAIDFSSGEGTSGRSELLQISYDIWMSKFMLGHGLGSDSLVHYKLIGGKMSHVLLLHVLIEVGIVGCCVWIGFVISDSYEKFSKFKRSNFHIAFVSIMLVLGVFTLSSQVFYLDQFIAIFLAIDRFFEIKLKTYPNC